MSLAVQLQCSPRCGDFIQAFCQSFLPKDETYIVRPPQGCPITPPRTYLKLRKTLYGLKRSPRHWFESATRTLKQCGLQPCKHAPCLFKGQPQGCSGNIYLGLYVDDFCYFGDNDEVEQQFRTKLESLSPVTFDDHPTHFLGLKIT